ncbi:MAG TPA: hypothetical protein VJ754_10630, partial [Anaerolineae bacterium]|nr:hypothetical protein [Anaerolineae bacterium]
NPPKGYKSLLGELPKGVRLVKASTQPVDVIQVFVASRAELEEQLPKLKMALAPNGLLWVTYHKGTSKIKTDIHRDSINAYARSIGLEGVAMISIDEDWSALRLKAV